jgi:hypothetical protein
MGEPIKLTANSSFGVKIAEGAYLHKGTVKSIIDFSNYPGRQDEPNKFETGWEPEICLKLFVEVEGREKPRELKLFNYFERDENSRIVGWKWGDAYRAVTLLCDEPQIDSDDFHLYEGSLNEIVGKEIAYVSYITLGTYKDDKGEEKPSYADWGRIFPGSVDNEKVIEEFSDSLDYLTSEKRNKNYRYAPEVVEKFDKSTKFGFSMEDNEAVKAMAPKDSDMPF